ncbi:MAG: DUF3604 domain-containing protein [Pseudomonadales bacterium]
MPHLKGSKKSIVFFTMLLMWLPSAHSDDSTVYRDVYFGDTHLHTAFSSDASILGNLSATPDVAYRFAKGLPVTHPQHGAKVQLDRPLDFLAVSDHAENMGVVSAMVREDERVQHSPLSKALLEKIKAGQPWAAFHMLLKPEISTNTDPGFVSAEINRDTWNIITDAADQHNVPGEFTALIAWEWSSMPREKGQIKGANLHRVVLMPDDADIAKQFIPYSSIQSERPEDLWAWLEKTARRVSTDFLAIPHNSNISDGRMFDLVDSDGQPISAAYANTRMRWEPVVETTQFKGDSESHPFLSPDDEFADYELFIMAGKQPTPGDYVRGGLRRGLEIEQKNGVNPYQYGQIGASDSHTGLASIDENNFHGKWAAEATPAQLLADDRSGGLGARMGAAGLAAVWANGNSREDLFAAFKRREVYATTGTRLKVRFFGGDRFKEKDERARDLAAIGYEKGVPMGATLSRDKVLASRKKAPSFLVTAAKDRKGANLDRIQIIKGWLDADGNSREEIYNVAMSDDRQPDANGKVSSVGDTVDRESGTYANSIGATQLAAYWSDPDYSEDQASVFYYARVLEIPTPRFSLIDAVATQQPHPPSLPDTVQERAYTSSIWIN